MALEIGKVRQGTYDNYNEGEDRPVRVNRRGELVVIDFWTQLVIDGRVFHMQIGNESAPVNSTTTVDDQLVWMVVDNEVGLTMLPAYVDIQLQTATTTAAALEACFEIDRAKARYNTGGTEYAPENLRTDRPRPSRAADAYVGTNITTNTKTAVPGSMEIARKAYFETAMTASNEPVDFIANLTPLFSARQRPGASVVGVGSMVVHFGATTALCTGYGVFQWGELPSESID